MAKQIHPHFRTRFDRVRVQLFTPPEERRTKSEFADECDINKIMERYRKTGVLPESAQQAAARYGDFSQRPGLNEIMQRMDAAVQLFEALPAKVRKQFSNDPAEFIEAAGTPEGLQVMKELGLGKDTLPPLQPAPLEPVQGSQPEPDKAPDKARKQTKTDE